MKYIKNKILKKIFHKLQIRPTSRPYISGDGFRAMADHIYDESLKINPEEIKENQIVFVKTDYIDEYFKNIHPYINNRYKLITHNSDKIIGQREAEYIDNKVVHWFAQNNVFAHPKITPIPIGIENEYWFMSGHIIRKMADRLKKNRPDRINRVIYGFNKNTNVKERSLATENLEKSKVTDKISLPLAQHQYFELLNRYKFVAAPEGNGPDCHRFWEAMILEVIPITKNTSNSQILSQNHLPALIINQWEDITSVTEEYLSQKYEELRRGEHEDLTKLNYWRKIVTNKK